MNKSYAGQIPDDETVKQRIKEHASTQIMDKAKSVELLKKARALMTEVIEELS